MSYKNNQKGTKLDIKAGNLPVQQRSDQVTNCPQFFIVFVVHGVDVIFDFFHKCLVKAEAEVVVSRHQWLQDEP